MFVGSLSRGGDLPWQLAAQTSGGPLSSLEGQARSSIAFTCAAQRGGSEWGERAVCKCTRRAARAVLECSVPPGFTRALQGKGMASVMGLTPWNEASTPQWPAQTGHVASTH